MYAQNKNPEFCHTSSLLCNYLENLRFNKETELYIRFFFFLVFFHIFYYEEYLTSHVQIMHAESNVLFI